MRKNYRKAVNVKVSQYNLQQVQQAPRRNSKAKARSIWARIKKS
jgi:hypothetical protein